MPAAHDGGRFRRISTLSKRTGGRTPANLINTCWRLDQTGGNDDLGSNNSYGHGTIVNDGTINAEGSGGTFYINPTSFTNAGTINVSNGDTLYIQSQNWTNSGIIAVTSGGALHLQGTVTGPSLGTLTKNGGTIVTEQSYSSGDKDFKAQLTSIKAANPEAIFVPGYYNEVGLIVRQARELGITVPLMGGDGWDSPTLTQIGGAAMEGNFFANHFSTEDQSPIIQDFIRQFKARFNRDPDGMAALGYDAAKVLLDAMTRAGSTESAKVRDALAATKDFQGVTGKITIDENRNANKSAVVLTIKDKGFHYVETIAP